MSTPTAPAADRTTRFHHHASRTWCTAVLFAVAACGDNENVLNRSHTAHGSLWTMFYATVTERYSAVTLQGGDGDPSLGIQETQDIWSVDENGLAQYLSTQQRGPEETETTAPATLAVTKLDEQALTALKNELARYRIFSWDSVYTCATVTCHGSHGTAKLEVNLNGENKSVTWPIAATGLPENLETMAQRIKDLP